MSFLALFAEARPLPASSIRPADSHQREVHGPSQGPATELGTQPCRDDVDEPKHGSLSPTLLSPGSPREGPALLMPRPSCPGRQRGPTAHPGVCLEAPRRLVVQGWGSPGTVTGARPRGVSGAPRVMSGVAGETGPPLGTPRCCVLTRSDPAPGLQPSLISVSSGFEPRPRSKASPLMEPMAWHDL